ncbi:hypothetical protein M9H77_23453 [Catharanthus roseus]|uniref:Uncharacterized protein n=1 Tax=Catharanthus roseus TaxID=4058 RepID=A0ACC0AV26_CATRO|nr:hypothetical protein M9H77_23453 [Catharanthus roseus]
MELSNAIDSLNTLFGNGHSFEFYDLHFDVDWKSQAPIELKLGPNTRAWMKKFKASNTNEDNGMVAYIEEALKNKFGGFGDQREAFKLFSICSIRKDHLRKQLEGEIGYNGYFKSLSYRLAWSFFESIDLESSNNVIGVFRPLFPQGSNDQSREELYPLNIRFMTFRSS